MSAPSGRSKSKSDDGSTPESAKKPGGKQPAQPPSKRLLSKSSGDPPAAPPRDPKIADLEKVGAGGQSVDFFDYPDTCCQQESA